MASLPEEIRVLARVLAESEDADVRDSIAVLCREYRRRRLVAMGLSAVESMLRDGPDVDEDDPRVLVVNEWFRDSLKELHRWARDTARLL